MSWRRSEALVRASAYSTAPRASVASTSGHALRASADATRGGRSGFGLPASRDHLVVVPLIALLHSRSTLPAEELDLTLIFTRWTYLPTEWLPSG